MLRDFKFMRRNSGKNLNSEETENVPVNVNVRESFTRMSIDSSSRPPLNTIQEPLQNPSKPDHESGFKSSKIFRTPTKPNVRYTESGMSMKTPEKQGGLARNRYGWVQDSREEGKIGNVNTPRSCRKLGRAVSSVVSEPNSTQSTPTKSVVKPPNPGLVYGGSSRPPVIGGARIGNFAALSKGIPVTSNTYTTVNTADVPHFDLREDPSFWMDHNVQVLIRIRPLNGMEVSAQGYNRCLKQESAQCLTWVGHPETRFTFDHVACETIDQETLFRMVGLPMVENCLSGYNSCMFAYGQTGSGKTHTMLGEINDLEVKPSAYRGMTPRIFEFLFARIVAEEESRRNERLTYNCKCSFLEIYNEQITDLLDPSSTNLQLREDVKKGVYVENLTEFEVHTVGDILKLLSQGSANRRVAATNMNRESSRSHSVFTCVIESRWEKDSTSNLRFARLNLVDLAGSERQKASGAEGERLKEAANINKSLSTLGHVIMVLVEGANARTRHVPYRDSRLTFLLQDSLGGNSKTMIIANVSPSICSATETLNTLKFAQRAKLIQNNAVINEDASGDVVALQHQIRLLKEELAILKRHKISRTLTFSSEVSEEDRQEHESGGNSSSLEMDMLKVDNMFGDDNKILRVSSKQLKSLETSLNGALRREQTTENSIKQLEAEIEQLNRLVRQREEENRCTKMMLKFREDKIQRMESLLAGKIPAGSYLLEENNTLTDEIRMLRAKVDRNPEVTRFAVENIRLLEQLRRFQDFYEEGEREMLLTEVSELRDQLVLFLDENSKQDNDMNPSTQTEAAEDEKENDSLQLELKKSQEELEKCRDSLNSCLEKNAKLCRGIADLNSLIDNQSSHTVQNMNEILAKYTKEVVDLQLEVEILKIILKEERSIHGETEENVLCLSRDLKSSEEKFLLIIEERESLERELQEAKSVIEALEAQQLISINELEDLRKSNNHYAEILCEKELKMISFNNQTQELNLLREKQDAMTECSEALSKKCKEKERLLNSLSEEIEEVLIVGHEALNDASNQLASGKGTWVSEQLKVIARNISEKEVRIKELNSCLEDAKIRGNEMEGMLRSLRGATLVMSEAHQQDCNKKDQEIRQLKESLQGVKAEKEVWFSEKRKLYEDELMDAKLNASQEAVESSCYLAKFLESQDTIKEYEVMIKELVTGKEAMKNEIEELKKKEVTFMNERDNYSVLEKQQVIDDKDEELRCLEEKLVTDLSAKDFELLILSSKLEQMASQSNDLEKGNVIMSMVLEFKEDVIVSYVDMQFRNWILLEKEAVMQEEVLTTSSNHSSALYHKNQMLEDEKKLLFIKLKDQKEEIKEFEAFIEALEYDLFENFVKGQVLRAKLKENSDIIFTFEAETKKEKERLETKLLEFETALDEKNSLIESLRRDLKTVSCDRDDLHVELLGARKEIEMTQNLAEENEAIATQEKQLYEDELMDAKLNGAQEAMESSCYLDKFVEAQCAVKQADFTINKLVIANEELKRKEVTFMNERDNHSVLEKQLKTETMGMKREIKELRCLEEKLVMDLCAKDFELLILLSKLEQMASQSNDLEKENNTMRLQEDENKIHFIKLKNQRDEIKEFEAYFEALECELFENFVKMKVFEAKLKDNSAIISTLEAETKKTNESLETEVLEFETALDEKNTLIESLKRDLKTATCERDDLHLELLGARKEVEMALALAEENEAIATEAKQLYELELMDAKINAAQQGVESSCYLDKFVEAKHTIKEAGVTINKLVTEKEAMNIEIEELKRKEFTFTNERDNYLVLEEQLESEIMSMKREVKELEHMVLQIQAMVDEDLMPTASDFFDMKSQFHEFSKLMRLSLEDIWFETTAKDWTLFMLHVCQMDVSNQKQQVINEKDDELRYLEEKLVKDLSAKDFELLILLSKLEQMASQSNDLEKENNTMSMILEKFKEDMIVSYVDMKFKEAEIDLLQKEVEMQEEALEVSSSRRSALYYENQMLEMSSCMLQHELGIKDAELRNMRLHEDENKTPLLIKLKDQKDEIKEFKASLEALECELFENIVKCLVFEAKLHEKLAIISILEADLSRERESVKSLSTEIHFLKENVETSKSYAEEKEKELKLYEKSVEELECTVNVLENQVDMVKGDAERQRLQRDELELELHALKQQIHTVKSNDSDIGRHLDEKEKSLQDVLKRIKILEKEIASKDAEIIQHKDHITELNLHAEAQAREYKQTFKALEAMADQAKPDGNSPSKRLEKSGSRSRGSGSPFKCIGIGLVQQMKSERDEELTAARLRIEELEGLAASRQKEIFTLNAKLAMSGSMTHDVLRDLLGIKSDMTTYSSTVDDKQIPNAEAQVNEQEVMKLKQQLNEFSVERKGLLEEIERKKVELEQLTTENEMFKIENANKTLPGQQNLQQKIHHHAKIKEENNVLKAQNDEISRKLRRSDAIITRVKEELASLRAANGKTPFVFLDSERQLCEKMKETEEKLVALCTGILKAAGVTRPSDVSISTAEEALGLFQSRVATLETELSGLQYKNRVMSEEQMRFSELMPQTTDEIRQMKNGGSQSSFLSTLAR